MRAVSLRVPVKLVPRAEAQKRTAAGLLLPIWILDPSSLRSDYKSPSQAVSVSSTASDHVENRYFLGTTESRRSQLKLRIVLGNDHEKFNERIPEC